NGAPNPPTGGADCPGAGAGSGIGFVSRIEYRNSTGSLPAACASSSIKDWMTNETALLVGARSAPVGTPEAITEQSNAKLGTNRDGNSVGWIPADEANRSPDPKLTK